MPSKADMSLRLPIRRGLSEPEAAIYIGLGVTKFRELVKSGQMPKPHLFGSRRVWDVDALDAAFKSSPIEGGDAAPEKDSWADFK